MSTPKNTIQDERGCCSRDGTHACVLTVVLAGCLAALVLGCFGQPDGEALAPKKGAYMATAQGAAGSAGAGASGIKGGATCTPTTCDKLGNPCGEVPDGCDGTLTCGTCLEGLTCGGAGFNACGLGECKPLTCEAANATCGNISDGCGHVLACGSCEPGSSCADNQCSCVPTTCAMQWANCGNISDGCGKVLDCGTCAPGQTCGANLCSCTPITCEQAGASCGNLSDGCGKVLDCGTCVPGSTCTNNACVCTPTTCAAAGAQCGSISDGCGKTLDCGACPGGAGCNNHICCNPNEICENGVDDNCNGQVDENCLVECEDTLGHNCNTDAGYGDHCAPSDNKGCTAEKFWAWCNRRNPAYPDIWDNYLKSWVDDRCDGSTYLDDPDKNGYPSFICKDSFNRTWMCTTPLVLAFDANEPVRFLPASHSFDVSPGSDSSALDWPTAATPWLAFDRNGNGVIDDGSELFGSSTALAAGGTARNGFEALGEYDSNHDGFVDASDCAWSRLLIWRDVNGDGISQAAELGSTERERVLGISITYGIAPRCDAMGNCERERAEFRWVDERGNLRSGAVIDIYLRSQPAR